VVEEDGRDWAITDPPPPHPAAPRSAANPTAVRRERLPVAFRGASHPVTSPSSRVQEGPALSPDPGRRRREAARAGHLADEARARSLLDDPEPAVRATALGALTRLGTVTAAQIEAALADPDPRVRRRGCEVATGVATVDLRPMLADPDSTVVEVAAWALGEWGAAASDAVDDLAGVATGHEDHLAREAAVAALGAIGDDRGLTAILAATADRATVRRRAVIALAPFSGPEVDAALESALTDRDWQVRQAAEDLTGRH